MRSTEEPWMRRRRDKEDWSGNVNSEIAYMPLLLELTRQRRRHPTSAPRVERGADESFGGDAEARGTAYSCSRT